MNQYEVRSLFARLKLKDYDSLDHNDFLQAQLDSGYMLDAPDQIPTGYHFQGKTHSKGSPITAMSTRG